MTLEWNDNLITGISVIDNQHQQLFATINKLETLKTTKASFYEVLIELQAYITLHFCTEEQYMRCTTYPNYEAHKACHDEFAKNYKNIIKKSTTLNEILDSTPEIISFVENWLTEHYTNEDVEMASYIIKNSEYKS